MASCVEYHRRFPKRRTPTNRVFTRVFQRLCETGVLPSHTIVSERAGMQSNNEVAHILQIVDETPSTSSRRISNQIRVPHVRVWQTLHAQGLYPFHCQRVQHLHIGDEVSRLQFCRFINSNLNLIPLILFTDEATFSRNGINNTRNTHRWSDENPHATTATNFQLRFSVNVWCGMIDNHLVRPVILTNRLNGINYLKFLQEELPNVLEDIPLAVRNAMIFQQDGAPAHSSSGVTDYLNQIFPQRWIGRCGPISWPPRSPDLTPLDYCLWGWFKTEVYRETVNTRE